MEKLKTIEALLAETFFVVEATSFETLCLWQQHSGQSTMTMYDAVVWEQVNPGYSAKVGEVCGFPVMLTMTWAKISGELVMFWDQCSRVTDSALAEGYIDARFSRKWDKGTRASKTNAMNFNHVIHALNQR